MACCWCEIPCKVLTVVAVLLVVLFFVFIIVFFTIFSVKPLEAYAASATLSRFDLVSGRSIDSNGDGGGGQRLQYNLTVDIRVRNRNHRVNYEYAEPAGAEASYGGKQLAFQPVQPFYLHHKTEHTVTATFNGSSLTGGDDRVARTYQREKGEGFYFVTLKLDAAIHFKYGGYNEHDYKSEIRCRLRLPVPNSDSPPVTKLETECSADFAPDP